MSEPIAKKKTFDNLRGLNEQISIFATKREKKTRKIASPIENEKKKSFFFWRMETSHWK